MVTKTATGNTWSDAGHWSPSGVPANGDAVIIPSGIDMIFDVDQSGFANGLLSLQIDGILRFKVDSITALKMNGNVTGTGSLYVGNSEADPIQRPPSGTESRCQLIFNSTATINVPTIRMYGWYPEREYAQLTEDIPVNSTVLPPLTLNMDLQSGDIVVISKNEVLGVDFTESSKGIYTVSSYDAATKTVTLTTGLQTARSSGDYVAWVSRPIKISRTSGTTALFASTSNINDLRLTGIQSLIQVVTGTGYFTNHIYRHCTARGGYFSYYLINPVIEYCTVVNGATISRYAHNPNFKGCINIAGNAFFVTMYNNASLNDCVTTNSYFQQIPPRGLHKNNIFKGVTSFIGAGEFHDSEINVINKNDMTNVSSKYQYSIMTGETKYINCVINALGTYPNHLPPLDMTFNNCLFNRDDFILGIVPGYITAPANMKIESFDHNQVLGNFKSWMNGGRIITENNKLKFICESNDYPVFRDYPILAPANRSIKFQVNALKNFNGGTVKLQIIDPSNDPLIDSTAIPLAEKSLVDVKDELNRIELRYRPTTSKQLIFRILCQNSTGNVIIRNMFMVDPIIRKKLE